MNALTFIRSIHRIVWVSVAAAIITAFALIGMVQAADSAKATTCTRQGGIVASGQCQIF